MIFNQGRLAKIKVTCKKKNMKKFVLATTLYWIDIIEGHTWYKGYFWPENVCVDPEAWSFQYQSLIKLDLEYLFRPWFCYGATEEMKLFFLSQNICNIQLYMHTSRSLRKVHLLYYHAFCKTMSVFVVQYLVNHEGLMGHWEPYFIAYIKALYMWCIFRSNTLFNCWMWLPDHHSHPCCGRKSALCTFSKNQHGRGPARCIHAETASAQVSRSYCSCYPQ